MKAAQKLPLRICESDMHLQLIMPLPDIIPAEISITITGRSVKISGGEAGDGDKHPLIAKWKMAPRCWEIQLAKPVSGSLTNATFVNGILTLAMPKVKHESDCSAITFQLELLDYASGERIGHKGLAVGSLEIG